MQNDIDNKIKERVAREKAAHTDDDVLENNSRLKRMFPHVTGSLTMRRFENEFEKYLDDVDGMTVLDLGCGHGEKSLLLLERGATVRGIDISQPYIDDVTQKAAQAGFDKDRFDFRVMDAHALTFADETFDLVIGSGILHHLDLQLSLNEINRVLRKGGRALFKEPLAANPLLKLFRILTPKARTVDEKPLTPADLAMIENIWNSQSTFYGLISAPVAMMTSILLRPMPNNVLLNLADWMEIKANSFPFIRPYNQYVLLSLVRK